MTTAELYRDEITRLVERLGFEEAYRIFRDRLLDQVSRGLIKQDSVRDLIRQIEPLFEPHAVGHQIRFEKDYDEALRLVNQVYSEMGVDVNRELDRVLALEKVNRAKWGKYSKDTVEEISRQVRESRVAGETSKDLAARFEKSVDEKVVKYADTLARSFVKGEGQELKNEKARLAGVEYMTYVGPPVITTGIPSSQSHRFCIELTRTRKRTFRTDDIDGMKNGQLEPVRIHRGGYRCRHDWEPNPFYSGKDYKVELITMTDGRRDIVFGVHRD